MADTGLVGSVVVHGMTTLLFSVMIEDAKKSSSIDFGGTTKPCSLPVQIVYDGTTTTCLKSPHLLMTVPGRS